MNTSEWSNIEAILKSLEQSNVEEKIVNSYLGQDLNQIYFGNFTITDFQRYFHEIIEKIKSIKENNGYKLLPTQIGNLHLYSNVSNFKSYCDQSSSNMLVSRWS